MKYHVLYTVGTVLLSASTLVAQRDPLEPIVATDQQVKAELAEKSGAELVSMGLEALSQADSALERSRRRDAIRELQEIVIALQANEPQEPWLSYFRGRLLQFVDRKIEAIEQLKTFIDTQTGKTEWAAYRWLGEIMVTEWPQQARAMFKKALALNPDQPDVLLGLSRAAIGTSKMDEAVSYARDAVDADGGQSHKFVEHLTRAQLAQADSASSAQRANLLAGAEQNARKNLAMARKNLADNPANTDLLKPVDDAFGLLTTVLNRRIEESPEQADLYIQLVDVAEERTAFAATASRYGQLQTIADALEAVGDNPDIQLLERQGRLLENTGRIDEAIEVYNQIIERQPDNTVAVEGLVRLEGDSQPEPAIER